MDDKDKIVVITGATGALGNKTAHEFAECGYSLALLDYDQTKLDSLVKELNLPEDRLFATIVDLRDEQAVRDAAEAVSKKIGGVHGLFHLVGGWTGGKTIAETPKRGRLYRGRSRNYRRILVGSHVVFYREASERLVVVRILHQRMDFDRHL
jgi:NADP-dependent 3-hydroxy acid dehydrogenase YdfG